MPRLRLRPDEQAFLENALLGAAAVAYILVFVAAIQAALGRLAY